MTDKEKWGMIFSITSVTSIIILIGVISIPLSDLFGIMPTREVCEVVKETVTVTVKECRTEENRIAAFVLGAIVGGFLPGTLVAAAVAERTHKPKEGEK